MKKYINRREFDGSLEISFPGKFNGIQVVKENRTFGSQLKLPRFAPEIGYDKNIIKKIFSLPEKGINRDYKDDNNYIFRIRSEYKDDKIIRAMYGKIHGDISFGVEETSAARFNFIYYLNPDYTRNLEFDPKRNLFTRLESFEKAGL